MPKSVIDIDDILEGGDYNNIFLYILMFIISLSIPAIDLVLYSFWLRWSSQRKYKLKSTKTNLISAPFPLNLVQFGATWDDVTYTGLTEYLWKFSLISIKGIAIAVLWPFWLFPIVIGTTLYLVYSIVCFILRILLCRNRKSYELSEEESEKSDSDDDDEESEDCQN